MNMSADAVDIILNLLSVGFLFDVDNAVYVLVLSREERAKWEHHTRIPLETQTADLPQGVKRNCVRAMQFLAFCVMMCVYGINVSLRMKRASRGFDLSTTFASVLFAFCLYVLLRSVIYEVACIWAQDTGPVQDARMESTICSWKKLIYRVLIALPRALVRCIFCACTLFPLNFALGWAQYVLVRDDTYSSQLDPEMVACVVNEDALACRRLH